MLLNVAHPMLIIILGAPNSPCGELSPMAKARVDRAVQEHRQTPSSQFLITGGWGEHFNTAPLPHAEYVKRALLEQGVAPGAIISCLESANTVEDAWLTLQHTGDLSGSMAVITSEHHVARARWIFECFFPPARLRFISTPSYVADDEMTQLRRHEDMRLRELKKQGGVVFDGRLYPHHNA